MRKTIQKTFLCVLLVLILCCSVACEMLSQVSTEVSEAICASGLLDVLRSDLSLSQEQTMSQIKAEYLLENGGYADDDIVKVLVTLNGDALIDSYNNKYYKTCSSVGDYALTDAGVKQAVELSTKQDRLISVLQNKGLIESIEHTYTTVINGFSATTRYGNLNAIQKNALVDSVIICDTYNRPQDSDSSDDSIVENVVDVYSTGIFNSGTVSYTGINTAVAILDSGFDCSHSVFQNQPSGDLLITQDDVSGILAAVDENGVAISNAVRTTPGLQISDVYYSDKIPFMYDYADKDSDIFPYDSEHGTHVAGIIGGKDDTITGVAVNTQLVLMKVFPDLDDGADTDDILAALEDAVLLKVDAINMSLGSSCGFAREEDGNKINDIYDKINEAGISLLTAASNSYSSGYGGEQGNTNLVTNPDSGTVGSPSTYAASLSVASISGTKSKYIVATDKSGNDSYTFFFLESNSITGEPNDFFAELGIEEGEKKTYEYVTVPGVGLRVNYSNIDVKGKIALVRRGDNTFEEKAQIAKSQGAIACIIYNNLDGDIYMSMGKSEHIPTVSISKDDGTVLASRKGGLMTISYSNQAGPFMSDFSSWGPSPSLELKPDITAHGGNILSAVPGGGYDELSGTSMATPNLCGIVVLIRQYLKEMFPDHSMKEITVMANQLLMSTATIVLNQEGNPYSPRKQGAGLASLYNAVNTNAYITVDGSDRAKLELGDDAQRNGVYTMEFNVVNFSDVATTYNLSVVGMTESVSTSDSEHVAEKAKLLSGTSTVTVDGVQTTAISVEANSSAKVKVVYTLSDSDKSLMDNLFPYGMYVEGYVKLTAMASVSDEGETVKGIDLNIPFLAFYGDWTEAPMFDKTYYEVESEAHNKAIDEEDKVKADYYATTPYGSYYYNYIIPLGTYLYDVDESIYEAIPASEDRIAISNVLGTIDGISSIYAGLLRNAKTMTFTITDKVTGEVVYETVDYNARKAYSVGGTPIPYYNFLKIKTAELGLVNNRQYQFEMVGLLDYGDGGAETNARNSFSFDFYVDDEAPIIKNVSYEKVYDKTLKKDRYYINLTVYDNHYVQSISPLVFTSSSSYTNLLKNPIPVYGERGQDTTVRFEITDYLEDILYDGVIPNGLAFAIDDYALNSNLFVCQLPGTNGNFKFTKDGQSTGVDLPIMTVYQGDVVDLTAYLSTTDSNVDKDKDFLKYLSWSCSNTKFATVQEGLVNCLKTGSVTITVTENMDGRSANIILNIRPKNSDSSNDNVVTSDVSSESVKSLRFAYFDTLFAYSRAAQTSEIGSTGDRQFLSSMSNISFYPGEKVKLCYDFDPWYAEDNYTFKFSSTNESVAVVNDEGEVTALKKGSATITLTVTNKNTNLTSNIMASVRLEVKSEFVIENRTLIAYKGLGGEVVIPDDEGILYVGAYSFCLYDTDYSVELPDDDFDANKIPAANTTVTSVVIPYGVEEIQKYAFYNCSGLTSVSIPTSCKYIREFAFYDDQKLNQIKVTGNADSTVGLEGTKTETIGRYAFYNCESLENINLSKVLTIGTRAFEKCSKLQMADLTALRNSGSEIFKDCTSLAEVTLNENTKLSYAMFVNSGLKSVDIFEKVAIPNYCFAQCFNLENVVVHNSIVSVGIGAFCECTKLINFTFADGATVPYWGEQAFYGDTALEKFVLPNCAVVFDNYCFLDCEKLTEIVFSADTILTDLGGSVFDGTSLSVFNTAMSNNYSTDDANGLLLNKEGNTVIMAAVGKDYSQSTLVLNYPNIGNGSFSGTNVKDIEFACAVNIGNFAFVNCDSLESVVFAEAEGTVISANAFRYTESLVEVTNLNKVLSVGDYAFANSNLRTVELGANSVFGEGVFFNSKLTSVVIGENSTFGMGAFQNCSYLTTVSMPQRGGVTFGEGCFANDILLSTIDLSTLEKIESETFFGCTALLKVYLTNATHIGDYAFADCSSLTYVTVPKLVSLGEGAFSRYSEKGGAAQFTDIVLPDTVTYIGSGAFLGCESLIWVTLPSAITEISDYLFTYCVNLASVTLPSTITSVGELAFYGCESLSEINLENVQQIGKYAFSGTTSLQTIDLTSAETIEEGAFYSSALMCDVVANSLTSVGKGAFYMPSANWGASLKSISAIHLKQIGESAFENNVDLTEFVFSSDLQEIDVSAFLGCANLESFYFFDNGKKVNNGEINSYATLVDGVLYTTMPSGKSMLTSVPAALNVATLTVVEGTYRVDDYAGNNNINIEKIVLPDTLKLIGNYAFFGYTNLQTVEFRSCTAPTLESNYDYYAELPESAPGYKYLHATYALGNWELCYYNFVALAGSKEPLNMILPANSELEGYDSLIYLVYFGSVADAQRSDYVARDKNLVTFYELAQKVAEINVVTMSNASLINNAVTAYNAIPKNQNPLDYGYNQEYWNYLVEKVLAAKSALRLVQLANASKSAQQLQADIDALPSTFDIANISTLIDITERMAKLTASERMLLDLTNYTNMQNALTAYNDQVVAEMQVVRQVVDNSYKATAIAVALVTALLAVVIKRRFL